MPECQGEPIGSAASRNFLGRRAGGTGMGRLQRVYSETGMYFVTARTFQARLLLTPSKQLNEIVGGVLARAVALSGIELHGYVVVSNHVHLLVTARGASLSIFMQYFLGNTARKVGRLVGWTGAFWQRRFAAAPVLDDESALTRLEYILAHGVKEGLVRTPADWPGLSCLDSLQTGRSEVARFFHWVRRWKKGALVEGGANAWDDRWAEELELPLTRIPAWAALSQHEVGRRVQRMVDSIVSTARETFLSVKGAKAVSREHPHRRPAQCKRSSQPLCHAATKAARSDFREMISRWVAAYSSASASFRKKEWTVEFPPWAFRPPVPAG